LPSHKTLLLIGTTAYNGMVHVDYLQSIMSIAAEEIPYTVMTTAGESLVTRARNGILANFYDHTEFPHLLFLDADATDNFPGHIRQHAGNAGMPQPGISINSDTSSDPAISRNGQRVAKGSQPLAIACHVLLALFRRGRRIASDIGHHVLRHFCFLQVFGPALPTECCDDFSNHPAGNVLHRNLDVGCKRGLEFFVIGEAVQHRSHQHFRGAGGAVVYFQGNTEPLV